VTLGFEETEGVFELGRRGELLDEQTLTTLSANELARVGRTPQSWKSHIQLMRAMTSWAMEKKAGKTRYAAEDLRWFDFSVRRSIIQFEGNLIAQRVSSVLNTVVQPRLHWTPRDSTGRHGRFKLTLEPDSLIGVLWLQASMSIAEQKRFRRCSAQDCPNLIELSRDSDGKRTDAKFCSGACRSRAYRRRHRNPHRAPKNDM